MKRINPRLAKIHRSYEARELADQLGVHENTVRGWIKEGLPVIDDKRPVLIIGSQFQAWWKNKQRGRKKPSGPGQMYCLKCREPKTPAEGMVECVVANMTAGNLKALCDTCGSMMHRRVRLDEIQAKMPGMDIHLTQAPPALGVCDCPSQNCDKSKGA